MIYLSSPSEICKSLANRLRAVRLSRNVSQQALAQMTGASLSSVRRMESHGIGSFELMVGIAQVLHMAQEFEHLFASQADSAAQLQTQAQGQLRQRASTVGKTTHQSGQS